MFVTDLCVIGTCFTNWKTGKLESWEPLKYIFNTDCPASNQRREWRAEELSMLRSPIQRLLWSLRGSQAQDRLKVFCRTEALGSLLPRKDLLAGYKSSECRREWKDIVCIPPFPSKLYHWCSLLTPQQNTNTTNQQGACSFSFPFAFFCLLQTFTLSLLLGNFIFGPENFRFDSGVASASASLFFLSESLNFVSVLDFGLTLGDDSSVDLKLKQR